MMTQTDNSDRNIHTNRLLKQKLGNLPDWTPPKIIRSVGPFEPEIFEGIFADRREVIEACQAKLANYSDEQILELISFDLLNPSQTSSDWYRFKKAEIDSMKQTEPAWFAGGFGHPDYAADFDYWSQSPHYTNHEALMLSLGVEPKHLSERLIETLDAKVNKKGEELLPPLQYLLRRKEQIRRQFPMQNQFSYILPQKLFDWFRLIEMEIPKEFTSRYIVDSGNRRAPSTTQMSKRPDKREIDTIAQLFTVMAIEFFGYRPKDARSPTPKEIVDAAAKAGIDISDDTVRKYLRLGAKFISPDWKPDGT